MAIQLRPQEKVILSVDFHWSTYMGATFHFLVFAVVAVLPWLAAQYLERIPALASYLPTVQQFMPYFVGLFLAVGIQPLAFRWLQNHCKHYVLTNERMYVEEGIVSKTKRSVPVAAINDVVLKQSIVQRLVGTGTVSLLTGNDSHCVVKNISYPDRLRRQVSRLIQASLQKAS